MSHTDILGVFPSLPPDVQVAAKLAACFEHHIAYDEFLDLDREIRAGVYDRAVADWRDLLARRTA